ncbi:BatD family protein [Aeromonas enteropelogenes]|uniref:BatD family protein n=1 Tax=Aeromonas enteropelogenes TaxID=29489 RepID=UPI003BA1496F
MPVKRLDAIWLVLLLGAPQCQAAEPQIVMKSWLSGHGQTDPKRIDVNEPLTLHIDVATDSWFSAATQVGEFSVNNLLGPRQRLSAYNYAQQEQGQSWSHQRWDLPLFPTKAGHYQLPALPVRLQVAGEDGKPRQRTLMTQPITFEVRLPPVNGAHPWIVAPAANLSQSWQQSRSELSVGDSITRQVRLSAEQTLSLLLPPLLTSPDNPMLAIYPTPTRFDDRLDRGSREAIRDEEVTYVLQQGGELTLPAIEVQWWNSQSGQLETLKVDGLTVKVHHTLKSWLKEQAPWLLASGVLLLLGWLFHCRMMTLLQRLAQRPFPRLLLALKNQEWPRCRQLIYQRLYQRHGLLRLQDHDPSQVWQQRVNTLLSERTDRLTVLICWLTLQ